jgi:hypothetical protein
MGGEVFYITEINANGKRGQTVKITDEDEAKEYTWQSARHSAFVEVRVDHDTSWHRSVMARQSSEG